MSETFDERLVRVEKNRLFHERLFEEVESHKTCIPRQKVVDYIKEDLKYMERADPKNNSNYFDGYRWAIRNMINGLGISEKELEGKQ